MTITRKDKDQMIHVLATAINTITSVYGWHSVSLETMYDVMDEAARLSGVPVTEDPSAVPVPIQGSRERRQAGIVKMRIFFRQAEEMCITDDAVAKLMEKVLQEVSSDSKPE